MEKQNEEPILRFPEFSRQWELKKLGDLFINRRQKGNVNLPIFSVTQDRGLISRKSLDRTMQNDAKPEDNLCVESNDLVYNTMRMWQGAIGIANQKCMVSPAYIVLKPRENISSKFFIQLFQKNRSLYLFTSYSYGLTSDRLRLYFKDFSDIKFHIPKYTEQQKISSFLNTIDDKITQLKKKEYLLEQYKKVVMLKLFSQELRFKDENGKDFAVWEEKKLGDIVEINKGEQLNKEELSETGEFPCINGGISPSGYTDKFNSNENTIIMSEGGASCGFLNIVKTKFWSGGHCYTFKIKKEQKTNTNYLFQLLKSNEIEIMRLRVGSGLPNIQKKDILLFKVLYCNSFPEQIKIANLLSAIDDKISYCGVQIEKMEGWKKGLLQKMFV